MGDDDGEECRGSGDGAGKREYVLVGPEGRRKRVVRSGDEDDEERLGGS